MSSSVDGPIVSALDRLADVTFKILLKFGAIILLSPVFSLPGIIIGIALAWLSRMYMKAQLSVKRERSNAKSPVVGHFGAALTGLGACT